MYVFYLFTVAHQGLNPVQEKYITAEVQLQYLTHVFYITVKGKLIID